MEEHSENFNKELENIRKNQPELKNTLIEVKNTLEGINNRLDNTEEQISYLKYRIVEITQSEQQKGKRIFKNEDTLRDLWNNIKHTNICIIG